MTVSAIKAAYDAKLAEFNSLRAAINGFHADILKQQGILADPTKTAEEKKKAAEAIATDNKSIVTSTKEEKAALAGLQDLMHQAQGNYQAWDMPKMPDESTKWLTQSRWVTDSNDQYGGYNETYYVDANGQELPPGAPEDARAIDPSYTAAIKAYNDTMAMLSASGVAVSADEEYASDAAKLTGTGGAKSRDIDPRLVAADFYSAQAALAAAADQLKYGLALIEQGKLQNNPAAIAAGKAEVMRAKTLAASTLTRMNNDAVAGGFITATEGGSMLGVPYTPDQVKMHTDLLAARTAIEGITTQAGDAIGAGGAGTGGVGGTTTFNYATALQSVNAQQAKIQTAADQYTAAKALYTAAKAAVPRDSNKIVQCWNQVCAAYKTVKSEVHAMELAARSGGWANAEAGKVDPTTGKVFTAEKLDLKARLTWFRGIQNTMRSLGAIPNNGKVAYVPPIIINTPVEISAEKIAA